jgi:hypothetical protein
MTINARVFLFILIIIALFGKISRCEVNAIITVITESRIYRNVTYEYRLIDSVPYLRVSHDTLTNDIKLSDVLSVYDLKGNDITSHILSMHGETKPVQRAYSDTIRVISDSGDYAIYQLAPLPTEKRLAWDAAIRFGPYFSVPAGNYYSGLKIGFGYEGSAHFAINKGAILKLSIASRKIKGSDNYSWISGDPDYAVIRQHTSLKTIRFIGSIQFYERIKESQNDLDLWYGAVGIGTIKHLTTAYLDIRYIPTGDMSKATAKHAESEFLVSVEAGRMISVGESGGLDILFEYNIVLLDNRGTTKNGGLCHIFDLKVGMIIPFKIF